MKKAVMFLLSAAIVVSLTACVGSAKTHELSKQSFIDDYGYSEEYWPWSADDTTVECKDHNLSLIHISEPTRH